MPRRRRVVTWQGKDVSAQPRDLHSGGDAAEQPQDEARVLSPEEEAGIEVALESYGQGRVFSAARAREIINAALRR